MNSSGIIGKKSLRGQTLIVAVSQIVSGIFVWLDPSLPFDRRLGPILLFGSVFYFAFFFCFKRCAEKLETVMAALSLWGIVLLTFIVHMTGGITSPLVFNYFALLISEVTYGVFSTLSTFAAIASYLVVVLGEATGVLSVSNPLARAIYGHHLVFAVIVMAVVSHMVMCGYFGRVILKKLRTDFAEEQKANQALLSRFAELETHSQMGVMVHRIVHDLRGPIGVLSGYMKLQMRSKDTSEDDRSLLSSLMETMGKITDSLSSLSRFGRMADGKKEKIMLGDFFRTLVSTLGYYADAGKTQFRQAYPAGADLCVLAVRQDLQQAYFNIFKNSIEALSEKGGDRVVDISMRPSGEAVEVAIVNNGPLIPGEILGQIFKKQVTAKKNGTGVGLLIAHDLLKKNSIEINISNEENTGVRITTRLPLHRVEA